MSVCTRCGAGFTCGMADDGGGSPCWCTALPALPPTAYVTGEAAPACFCPACLRTLLETERGKGGSADQTFGRSR